jgi:hypothetical protein
LDHNSLGREEEGAEAGVAVAALAVELVGCLFVEAVAVVLEGPHSDSFELKEPCGSLAG